MSQLHEALDVTINKYYDLLTFIEDTYEKVYEDLHDLNNFNKITNSRFTEIIEDFSECGDEKNMICLSEFLVYFKVLSATL